MNKINLPFDYIYCILLPTNSERVENVKKQCELLNNVKVFNSIYIPNVYSLSNFLKQNDKFRWNGWGNGTALNCTLNHYTVIKQAYDANAKSVLIFEDDVTFNDENINKINEVMNNIPKNYNILRFEWVKYWGGYIRKEKRGYFTKSNHPSWGTQCYALDKIGIEYYLKYMDNMLSVADMPLYDSYIYHLNQYYCNIETCKELNFKSTIQTR